MEKFRDAHALIKDTVEVCAIPRLDRAVIERAHTPAYLDAVSYDNERGLPHGLSKLTASR